MPYAELKAGESNTQRKRHYNRDITRLSFKTVVLCKKALQSGSREDFRLTPSVNGMQGLTWRIWVDSCNGVTFPPWLGFRDCGILLCTYSNHQHCFLQWQILRSSELLWWETAWQNSSLIPETQHWLQLWEKQSGKWEGLQRGNYKTWILLPGLPLTNCI